MGVLQPPSAHLLTASMADAAKAGISWLMVPYMDLASKQQSNTHNTTNASFL